MKAQREVWGETMASIALEDDRLVVIDGDLATSTRADIVADRAPESFIQLGIAEQNMVGVAFGLTTMGYRPWLSSFSVFLTHRCLDQTRMLVSQTKAPVRFASAYSGLLNGSSGKTHQDLTDIAIMRSMPNMAVLAPADEFEAAAASRWAAEHEGPVYLRLARDAVEPVFDGGYRFVVGQPHQLAEGDDVTLISTGVQTSRTVAAAVILRGSGIAARVIHLPTIKPLDEEALLAMIGTSTTIVTVEEHSVIGGLGGLVSEVVAGQGVSARVHRLGLADGWAESAPNDFLLEKYELSSEKVASRITGILHDETMRTPR
ncbi:MAG TPA: transketolase C-terminal domain-containing protein [Vicinamibacterales bacterium]|nr:transketolase C-terminal domain-containing protein [Vicinamibacterales bacterium]